MAGAGYKLYATGDVLTAAQVNNYLQEQTVMVFADAAARTTALASVLAEGMISYLKDTNSTEYYSGSAWIAIGGSSPLTTKGDLYGYSTTNARVAVGTNGQVLTADSSAATGITWSSPTTGGLTFITSATASTGTLSINNCFSSTYKNYLLEVNLTTSTNCNLAIRYRASGTDNTSAVYSSSYYYTRLDAANTGTSVAGSATSLNLHVSNFNRKWEGPLSVMNPNAVIATTCSYNAIVIDSSDYYDFQGGGVFTSTDQFDGISFIASAGTLSGTVKVYGYQN